MEEEAWAEYAALDSAEYIEIHDLLQASEHVTPLRYHQGDTTLTLIASRHYDAQGKALGNHDYNPDSLYHRDLDLIFKRYLETTAPQQRLGIVEGNIRSIASRDVAIRLGTESGHLAYVAAQVGMEVISGEPSEAELQAVLFQTGVTRQELAALYTVWSIGGLVRSGGTLEQLGAHMVFAARQASLTDTEIPDAAQQAALDPQETARLLKDLDGQAVAFVPQLNSALGREWFGVKAGRPVVNYIDETSALDAVAVENVMADAWWPDRPGRINDVCRLVSSLRDKHLFRLVVRQLDAGKSPVVPFGSSHIAQLKPCFDAYFTAPPTVA